jgi:hypothetical protein
MSVILLPMICRMPVRRIPAVRMNIARMVMVALLENPEIASEGESLVQVPSAASRAGVPRAITNSGTGSHANKRMIPSTTARVTAAGTLSPARPSPTATCVASAPPRSLCPGLPVSTTAPAEVPPPAAACTTGCPHRQIRTTQMMVAQCLSMGSLGSGTTDSRPALSATRSRRLHFNPSERSRIERIDGFNRIDSIDPLGSIDSFDPA